MKIDPAILKIDILQKDDLPQVIRTFTFPWTTVEATQSKWDRYYQEQEENSRIVCLAKCQEQCVGYGSLVKKSEYPGFRAFDIPEIHDVWISEEYRGNGFGTTLVQYLEGIAQQKDHREIGIGVGLYKDYGRAQRLYIQLGYIPDGEGVTYRYSPIIPGEAYPLDDDLVIWLKKKLSIMKDVNLRRDITQLIALIKPLDPLEREHIDFVLQWITSGVEIFRTEKPATPEPHLVSYFILVSPEQSKILLVDHKKAELWLPSGGHVEPGEYPKETVRREAKEELGIEAEFLFEEPIFLTVSKTVGNVSPHTDVSLWYVLKGDPKHPLIYDSEEFQQIQWFGIDEIPLERADPHMKRFIQKLHWL